MLRRTRTKGKWFRARNGPRGTKGQTRPRAGADRRGRDCGAVVGWYGRGGDCAVEEPAVMKSRSKGGFTLVELLVVVAIIGILMGILLPTLTGAMARAKETQCLNNMGQHAKGLIQYASQNRNQTIVPGPTGEWMAALDRYLAIGQRAEARLCPYAVKANTRRGSLDRAWTKDGWIGSIAINSHLATQTPGANDFTTMSQPDSATPAFVDGAEFETGTIASTAWPADLAGSSNWILDRHRKGIAMSFCDGHSERVELAMIWDKKWHRNYVPQGRQTNPTLGIE